MMKWVQSRRIDEWIAGVVALAAAAALFNFINAYAYNVPFFDDSRHFLDAAFRTSNDSLTRADVLPTIAGHLQAIPHITVIIASAIAPWQPITTVYWLFVIALVRYGLVIGLFAREQRGVSFAIAGFALFVFALPLNTSWLASVNVGWHYALMFLPLVYLVLARFQGSLWGLVLAAVLATFGAVAIAAGLVIFPAVLLTLWAFGYRWRGHVVWLILSAVIIGGLLTYSGGGSNLGSDNLLGRLLVLPVHAVGFAGGLFHQMSGHGFTWHVGVPSGQDHLTAVFAGAVIVGVSIINGVVLFNRENRRAAVGVWGGFILYTLGVGALLSLGRSGGTLLPIPGADWHFSQSVPAALGWLALAILAAEPLARQPERTRRGAALLWGNVAVAVILGLLFVRANAFFLQNVARLYDRDMSATTRHIAEICVAEYPLTQRAECLGHTMPYEVPDDIYRMAYYRMSVFRDAAPTLILPAERLGADDRILLETNTPWMNAYARNWWLNGVAPAHIFNLTAPENNIEQDLYDDDDPIVTIDELRDPLTNWITTEHDDITGTLDDYLRDADTVWHITNLPAPLPIPPRTDVIPPTVEPLGADVLTALGYIRTDFTYNTVPYRDHLTITRWKRLPDQQTTHAAFAEGIRLRAFTLSNDEIIAPCEVVTLTSWWDTTTAGAASDNYALRWVLLDVNGNEISAAMSGLTNAPTLLWEPDALYLDERAMALPCELAPGDYRFAVSVENADRTVRLDVMGGALNTDDNRAILDTGRVE